MIPSSFAWSTKASLLLQGDNAVAGLWPLNADDRAGRAFIDGVVPDTRCHGLRDDLVSTDVWVYRTLGVSLHQKGLSSCYESSPIAWCAVAATAEPLVYSADVYPVILVGS